MTRGDNGHDRRTMQMGPSVEVIISQATTVDAECKLPFTLVINDKFEHAMPIWYTKSDRVFPWLTSDRQECRADMWVEHSKFQLHVLNAGVRLPCGRFRVVF